MQTKKSLSVRSLVAIGGVAAIIGLLLGATILGPGAAIAQETPTPTAPDPRGDTPRGARQTERIRLVLEDLVDDGTITEEQADAVASHLASQWKGRKLHRLHAGLDVAAATIGITEADLVEAMRNGQTVAEIAESNGVSSQTVIDALVAEVNSRVDEAVAHDNLEGERGSEIKANAVERVTDFVNGARRFRDRPAA